MFMKKIFTLLSAAVLTAVLAIAAGAAVPDGYTEKELFEDSGSTAIYYDYFDHSADTDFSHYYKVGDGYVTVDYDAETDDTEITISNVTFEENQADFIYFFTENNNTVTVNVEGTNTFDCHWIIDLEFFWEGADLNTLFLKGTGTINSPVNLDMLFNACRVKVESGTYNVDYFAHCSYLDIIGGNINFTESIASSEFNISTDANVNGVIHRSNVAYFYGTPVFHTDTEFNLYPSMNLDFCDSITVDGILVLDQNVLFLDPVIELAEGTGIIACENSAYTTDGTVIPHAFYNLTVDYTESDSGEYWSWDADEKVLTLNGDLVIYNELILDDDVPDNAKVTVIVNGNVYVGDDIEADDIETVVLDIRGYMFVDDNLNSVGCRSLTVRGGGVLEVDDEIMVHVSRDDYISSSDPITLPEDHEDYGVYDNTYLNKFALDGVSPAVLTIEKDTWLLTDEELDVDKLVVNGMLYVEDSTFPAIEIYHSLIIGRNGGILVKEDPSDEDDSIADIGFMNFWNLTDNELHNLRNYNLIDDDSVYFDYSDNIEIEDESTGNSSYIDNAYFYSVYKLLEAAEINSNYSDPKIDVDFDITPEVVIGGDYVSVTYMKTSDEFPFASDFAAYARLLMHKYRITLEASEGGSITGKTDVNHNNSAVYTIEADEGYVLTELTINGKKVELSNTITLDKVRSNYTIKAVFTPAE